MGYLKGTEYRNAKAMLDSKVASRKDSETEKESSI
jgi:hypothetical protein